MAKNKKSGNGLLIIGGLVVLVAGGAGVAFAFSGSSKAKSAASSRAAELDAQTAAALANVEVQKALAAVKSGEMQADMFKQKMDSLNVPIGSRLLDGFLDLGLEAAGGAIGAIDWTGGTEEFLGAPGGMGGMPWLFG